MGAIFWSLLFRHTCVCPRAPSSHTTHLQIHTTRRASLDAARRPMRGACRDVPFALYTALRCTTQLSRDERAQCSSCGSVPVRPNYTTALSTPQSTPPLARVPLRCVGHALPRYTRYVRLRTSSSLGHCLSRTRGPPSRRTCSGYTAAAPAPWSCSHARGSALSYQRRTRESSWTAPGCLRWLRSCLGS